ncbi:MAG: VIT1/CCC1 transporter family protein [Candidatus Saccharibacteria bacterium]|nr:VIT1/CCC1 transporter family protein [Candidatus Saccharibacteria bacterium]
MSKDKGVVGKVRQHFEDYLREFVYGGIDGAITTFAVVAGSAGAGFEVTVILVLGFANLIADGLSMGVGSYLSTKSEIELAHKHGEAGKGSDDVSPAINGVTTYFAFIFFGLIPLLAYTLEKIFDFIVFDNTFLIACIFTAVAFVAIGALKSKVAETSIWRSVGETVFLGVLAAVLAYGIGYLLESLIVGAPAV